MNHRGSKVMEIVVTNALEGNGTVENPSRIVYYSHDKRGRLLAIQDHYLTKLPRTDYDTEGGSHGTPEYWAKKAEETPNSEAKETED